MIKRIVLLVPRHTSPSLPDARHIGSAAPAAGRSATGCRRNRSQHRDLGHLERHIAPATRIEPAHLARRGGRARDRAVADHATHRRIVAQPVSVVHILIGGEPSEYRLPQQADRSVTAVLARARIGKRVAAHFVSSPYGNFGRTNPPAHISYPETCTWYGALTFARVTSDTNLTAKLLQRFEPLFGADAKLIPKPVNVDSTVFGAVPFEIYIETKDKRCLDLGKSLADKQWETPTSGKLSSNVQAWAARGLSWHTRFWIDDMFMITAVQIQAYRATGAAKYLDRAAQVAR